EAGAILACGSSPGAEGCCWAVVGRLADELRPWEDFTGSDSPTLLSATLLLGWLAMEKVLYCDDWEDAATGEIQCSCGAPLPADGKPSEVMNGRLIPAAPRAARALLQLLAEVVVAGEASNVHSSQGSFSPVPWQMRTGRFCTAALCRWAPPPAGTCWWTAASTCPRLRASVSPGLQQRSRWMSYWNRRTVTRALDSTEHPR
ncbi:unnamed protein product, partial [Effrenium voratum]